MTHNKTDLPRLAKNSERGYRRKCEQDRIFAIEPFHDVPSGQVAGNEAGELDIGGAGGDRGFALS